MALILFQLLAFTALTAAHQKHALNVLVDKCCPLEKVGEIRWAGEKMRVIELRAEVELLMWRLAREMIDQGYPDRYEAR